MPMAPDLSILELFDNLNRGSSSAIERQLAGNPSLVKQLLPLEQAEEGPALRRFLVTQSIDRVPHTTNVKTSDQIRRDTQERRLWCSMMTLLLSAGLEVDDSPRRQWLITGLKERLDCPTLHWLLDQNVFSPAALSTCSAEYGLYVVALGMVDTLRPQGPSEQELLRRLHDLGLLSGPRRLFGITDLACAGQWLNAQILFDLGERPQVCKGAVNHSTEFVRGESPIDAYLGSLSPRGSHYLWPKNSPPPPPQQQHDQAHEALHGLRRLVAWGAPVFDHEEPDWPSDLHPPLRSQSGRSSVFASLLGEGPFSYERAVSVECLRLLGPELLTLGGDLNDGSALASRLATLMVSQLDNTARDAGVRAQEALQWSVEHGLDLSRHAGAIHSALWSAFDLDVSRKLAHFFDQQGARFNRIAPTDPSPVRGLFLASSFEDAWLYVDAGAPLHYVDQHAEGVLHLLAPNATKAGLAQLKRCLTHPELLPLLHLSSTKAGQEGEQPLHRACAVLNAQSIAMLLDAGADANAQDAKGWTPIRHLLRKTGAQAQRKVLPLLRLLIERGGDVSIRDAKGLTAAQSAAARAPLPALAALLDSRPQDIGAADRSSKKANVKLRQRGDLGMAMAEQADLRNLLGVTHTTSRTTAPSTPSPHAEDGVASSPSPLQSSPKRRRL